MNLAVTGITGEIMAVRCPCGVKVEGEGEQETTANVREHLITYHDVSPTLLMDVAGMLDELGDEMMDELLKLDSSMRSHLAPPTRTSQEIRQESEESDMIGCVSELPLTREQMGDYEASMFCSFCGRKLVADDEVGLSKSWGEHLIEHSRSGLFPLKQLVVR
jgi:hypothetical protein